MNDIIAIIITIVIGYLLSKFSRVTTEKTKKANIPANVLQWESEAKRASMLYDVPKDLILAVIWQESRGDKEAKGSAGEVGLMQLKKIAVDDVEIMGFGSFPNYRDNVRENIQAGTAYLALQRKRTGDLKQALKAYNQGYSGMNFNPDKAKNYANEVWKKYQVIQS